MKIIKPNYYQNFQCIAEQCRHNCCIGWEIDIDEDTLSYYQALGGEMGARLKKEIATDSTPHFILSAHERCPFLNDGNLCDIITELGEESLCQICSDHPRFRNHHRRCTELGLGLCCEAAGRLILTQKEPTRFNGYSFLYKKKLLRQLQNRKRPLEERLQRLSAVNPAEYTAVFRSLERLDPRWDGYLDQISSECSIPHGWEPAFEQLAVYFIYRHLLPEQRRERCALAVLSVRVLASLFRQTEQTAESLVELARLYSAEIEYSDENLCALLKAMADHK